MTRVGAKLLLAGAVLAAAALVWWTRPAPPIERVEADAIAERVISSYVRDTGDFRPHFAEAAVVDYPDGWDYSWPYNLCPDDHTELRVFVTRHGEASITATPECDPVRGFGVGPRTV